MSRRVVWPLLGVIGLLVVFMVWFSLARSIRGQVKDAETNLPLAGVVVNVAGRHLVTDAEGRFEVWGLRGMPAVQAALPGYSAARVSLVTASLFGMRQVVAVSLDPTRLKGAVLDATTGAAIAGAIVRVGDQTLQTDAQGRYEAKRVLPQSKVIVQARYYAEPTPVIYDGQPTQDIALTVQPVTVTVRDAYSNEPVAGATLSAGGQTVQSNAQGSVVLERLRPGSEVVGNAPGYIERRGKVNPGDQAVLALQPTTVRGVVRDAEGKPVAGALVLLRAAGQEPRLMYTAENGEYRFDKLPDGASLLVRKAGFKRVERQLGKDGGAGTDFKLEPFAAKAIYLAFHMLRPDSDELLQKDLEIVDKTELNAVVIEVKAESGWLAWKPQLKAAQEADAAANGLIDLQQFVQDLHKRGIYVIARMPVFIDERLSARYPELAVRHSDGSMWKDWGGNVWLDPFHKEIWQYDAALAKEAVGLGFDEIQFDYVRFPSDGSKYDLQNAQYSGTYDQASRVAAITGFLAYARQELDKTGAFLSADLFGETTFTDIDDGLGQMIGEVGKHVDYISPMVYPSTYSEGMLGLTDPWRQVYEVVNLSMKAAHERTPALIRPWIQHYQDYHGVGIVYSVEDYRAQKKGAEDGNSAGWMYWNILGEYDIRTFDP